MARHEDVVLDRLLDDVDPVIAQLFLRLPKPGADWPLDQRVLWLQAMESVLHMVYGPVETIDVSGLLPIQREAAGAAETTEAPAKSAVGSERSSSAEADRVPVTKTIVTGYERKNLGGAPSKAGRPADIPANLAMAVECIAEKGPSSAPQIREWARKKYWPGMPESWTAVLYDFVKAGKLARDGLNFVLPREKAPMPPVATPIDPSKQGFPPKREVTVPALRKPTPPAPAAARLLAFTFKHGDKSAMLSTTQQLLVANRLYQVKGQHVAESFLAEKAFGSNTERFREQVKALALGLNGPLFDLGLKVTYYPGHGLMMREIEA